MAIMVESRLFGADNFFGIFRKLLKMYCNICLNPCGNTVLLILWKYSKCQHYLYWSLCYPNKQPSSEDYICVVIRTTCTSSPFGMMNFFSFLTSWKTRFRVELWEVKWCFDRVELTGHPLLRPVRHSDTLLFQSFTSEAQVTTSSDWTFHVCC